MKKDRYKFETNNAVWKKAYKRIVCNEVGKCTRCPWHGGMDNATSRIPKPDKYKSKRKGRI